MKKINWMALVICSAFLVLVGNVFAHCDGLDGPVVQAAEKAIATGNVDLVLVWVQKADEPAIRTAFTQTLTVRKLGAEARALADQTFFETLVRVHRAGEGAAFTGLKPAGRDLGPAIPAADKALEQGSAMPLIQLLTKTIQQRLEQHFQEAMAKRNYDSADVVAGREYVKAYVEYIHFVEALYAGATSPADGHYPEKSSVAQDPKEKNGHGH
jgi:hypothetical protein